tara:strand:- start:7729 stop:8559 length:831 start_codon:yes stop_codon:yes gene_type:complete
MIDYKNTAIVIFAYNRPSHLKRVLVSLQDYGIKKFFVFLDGPKNKQDKLIQDEITFIVKNLKFAKVKLIKNKSNFGLAKSIISGVTKILKKFENIIVIEDDCIPFKNFFNFMASQLKTSYFKNECAAICSYMFPEISEYNSKKLYPILLNYFISWGWATNKKNWEQFLNKKKNKKIKFNVNTPYSKFLKKKNLNSIWTINFIYHNLNFNKKYIYPNYSLVKNIGFDGSGINSKVDNSLRITGNKNKKIKLSKKIIFKKSIKSQQEKILLKKLKLFY